MKKTVLALFLVAAFILTALPLSVGAQANVDNSFRIRQPVEGEVVTTPVGCEDLIHTSGYINVFGHMTDLGDGEQLLVFHANPQHVVLEGMETGNIYHGVGNTQIIEQRLGPGEGTITGTLVYMQVPQVGYQAIVYYTIDSDGNLVVTDEKHYIEPGFNCG